jgi:hypothetical protein
VILIQKRCHPLCLSLGCGQYYVNLLSPVREILLDQRVEVLSDLPGFLGIDLSVFIRGSAGFLEIIPGPLLVMQVVFHYPGDDKELLHLVRIFPVSNELLGILEPLLPRIARFLVSVDCLIMKSRNPVKEAPFLICLTENSICVFSESMTPSPIR